MQLQLTLPANGQHLPLSAVAVFFSSVLYTNRHRQTNTIKVQELFGGRGSGSDALKYCEMALYKHAHTHTYINASLLLLQVWAGTGNSN